MIAKAVSHGGPRDQLERKRWFWMLGCSLILHATFVVIATARWGINTGKQRMAPIYSVELVSLPLPNRSKQQVSVASPRAKKLARRQAIPIRRFRAKKQPFELKKKQLAALPSYQPEEVEVDEQTLTKIEPRLPPSPPPAETDQVMAGKKKVSLVNIGGMMGEELSQALGLYRGLVNERIENNWAYPERLRAEQAMLEAIVVVRARRDGTVFDIQFEKKSGNPYFDDSVLKAILKSKPFPPFPDIYSPKEEEIVIRFSPPNQET
ncbi:MAG: TonB family protein [Deltaproteobacteria bacterium]|nr:MAG: TonB family protein [Deltaproteobacteria bacterium]